MSLSIFRFVGVFNIGILLKFSPRNILEEEFVFPTSTSEHFDFDFEIEFESDLFHFSLSDHVPNLSPILHHKKPFKPSNENDSSEDSDEVDECRAQTNLFGMNFLMWFEVGIEGKDPMDQEEEDWGGKIEFGFQEKTFPADIEDYFLLFEDRCF